MPTLPASSSLVSEKPRAAGQYALLRGVPLFAALDDAAVEELFGYLHPVELQAGSNLFRVGDAGDAPPPRNYRRKQAASALPAAFSTSLSESE